MAKQDVIDKEVINNLLESVGGDGEFLAELLETYFSDTPQQFAAMQSALSAGNAEDFRRAAHSLKSNSANFGAMKLSEQAKRLEELGKSDSLDQVGAQLEDAEAEYGKVKNALEMIRQNG